MFRGSTIGQTVKMLETEYVSNLSSIPREKYDDNVMRKFKEFVKLCDGVLRDRRIAPSQADRVMSYKMLIEREVEWYSKKVGKVI